MDIIVFIASVLVAGSAIAGAMVTMFSSINWTGAMSAVGYTMCACAALLWAVIVLRY